MQSRLLHLVLVTVAFCATLKANAQLSMPDRVYLGTSKRYWVDSAANTGSTYTWAIDGKVVQRGSICEFSQTWNLEGTYELTLIQVPACGGVSEMKTGQVIVDIVPTFTFTIFPNPLFGPELRFRLTVAVSSLVTIDLFESNGQLISRVFAGQIQAGESKVIAYYNNLPQGIYWYRIRTEKQTSSGRLIVIRTF
jgi:hypothetical protein